MFMNTDRELAAAQSACMNVLHALYIVSMHTCSNHLLLLLMQSNSILLLTALYKPCCNVSFLHLKVCYVMHALERLNN